MSLEEPSRQQVADGFRNANGGFSCRAIGKAFAFAIVTNAKSSGKRKNLVVDELLVGLVGIATLFERNLGGESSVKNKTTRQIVSGW